MVPPKDRDRERESDHDAIIRLEGKVERLIAVLRGDGNGDPGLVRRLDLLITRVGQLEGDKKLIMGAILAMSFVGTLLGWAISQWMGLRGLK